MKIYFISTLNVIVCQAYDPDVTEYQHTQPTEEALIERIELRRVAHAIEVYNTMKRLGITFVFLSTQSEQCRP